MPRKKKGADAVQTGNIREFFQTATPLREITNNEIAQNPAAAPRAQVPSSTRSLKFDQISTGHAAGHMQEEDVDFSGICRCLCVVHICSPFSRKLFAQEKTKKKKKRRTITIELS
jgi:hypothetical protein